MDGTNAGGPPPRVGPPGSNILMRPPPPHGQGQGNGIARPPHPARPPPHQQPQEHQRLQQLQPGHPAQNPAARSPVMSPFHKPEGGSSGSSPQPLGQSVRPVQNSPPGQNSIQIPGRPSGLGGPGMNQQRPVSPHQQHPQRPHPPPGQQPPFGNPGRPLLGPNNPGSQGQLRPSGSPQAQPLQVHPRPHLQGQQALQPNNVNGQNLRPSASHPNLAGPGAPPANRFTPPSPSLTTTRSPQIRPLQQTQPQGHPPQQPTLRPSGSHPHLAQSRPPMPPAQQSPVLAHQTLNIRPPTPTMQQQQVRPRPSQGPPGQSPIRPHGIPSPRQAPIQVVQVEIPTSDSQTNGGNDGFNRPTLSSSMPHLPPQQRPPRPTILDQMRQSPQSQPSNIPSHTQNPTQRLPQRPPTPQGQQGPFRQGSGSGSPQRIPTNDGSHTSSADQSPKGPEHGHVQEVPPNGDHGRPQQHATPPNQRLSHPPQNTGHGAPNGQGHLGQPQHPQQRFNVPPSPGQQPLGATIPGAKAGPAPQNHLRPPPHEPESEAITLAEPDAPLSDSNDEGFDDDDIEGGAPKMPSGPSQTRSKPPPSESTGEKSGPPPPQRTGGPPPPQQTGGGPPLGPPRGPPKNENTPSRKLSSASGSGPVQILAPSNNPSSPPASAFPPMGQPRPRVRPPPGNKQHTPYRPPERPSQAPVMYSQSGQPAFSQPFPQEANGSDDSTAQTPLLSQGLESASSSVRPREGGLHKRVVANDNNTQKADSPANAPPSPKVHGLKGPAILSVSGQKAPSSAAKTLKTWAIRGGLAYLGYTAVFNCAPDSTGVRGLYCKATNGVGGLIKPFVAPHYNAHVGPHVDRYVKPVARQGHKIYIKVADPVVQGALSAAGAVYKSTAKKHVDSAKDQSKTDSSNEAEEPKEHPKSFEKVSRQPVHVDEPHGSVNQDQDRDQEKPHLSETLEQTVEEVKETLKHVDEKVAEAKEAVLDHLKPIVETVHHVVEEVIEHVHHEKESKEVNNDHVVEQDSNNLDEDAHVVVDEVNKGDPILDGANAFPNSMKRLDNDVVDTEAAEEPQTETVTEAKEVKEEKEHWYAAPDPEPAPTPELEVDPVPTADEPVAAGQQVEVPEPTPEATPVPLTEATVVESIPTFADIPTLASEVPETEPLPAEEHVETHVEPVVEAVHDTNTDTSIGGTHSEPHVQEKEHEEPKASHEEHVTHPFELHNEVAEEVQDAVVPKEVENEGEQAGHLHEQQAAHVPEAGDSTSGHDEL